MNLDLKFGTDTSIIGEIKYGDYDSFSKLDFKGLKAGTYYIYLKPKWQEYNVRDYTIKVYAN